MEEKIPAHALQVRRLEFNNMSLMDAARMQYRLTGQADAAMPTGVNAAPMRGPATKSMPAGNGVSALDAYARKRTEAAAAFNGLRANATTLVQRYGRDAYEQALAEAEAKASAAHENYIQAASALGLGNFTE